MDKKKIGKVITSTLKQQRKSVAALAREVGAAHSTVNGWKRGLNLPNEEAIEKLCKALSISRGELVGLELTRPSEKTIQTVHELESRQLPTANKAQTAELIGLLAESLHNRAKECGSTLSAGILRECVLNPTAELSFTMLIRDRDSLSGQADFKVLFSIRDKNLEVEKIEGALSGEGSEVGNA